MSAEDALADVMNLMETEPSPSSSLAGGLGPTAPDIPALREQLAVLVSTGKAKEAIGVPLTHEEVKRLSNKYVEKLAKRYGTYVGSKTTESLIDSFIFLATAKHIDFSQQSPVQSHPSRDENGYPLEGVDEVPGSATVE